MNTTYTCRQPSLSVNRRNDIVERDERCNIVGVWYGYYNPKRYTVRLYPNRTHPFFKFVGEPRIKEVSAGLIKCTRPEGSVKAQTKAAPVRSQTARAMRELIGQEKFKF